jgi:hypothetical protein
LHHGLYLDPPFSASGRGAKAGLSGHGICTQCPRNRHLAGTEESLDLLLTLTSEIEYSGAEKGNR